VVLVIFLNVVQCHLINVFLVHLLDFHENYQYVQLMLLYKILNVLHELEDPKTKMRNRDHQIRIILKRLNGSYNTRKDKCDFFGESEMKIENI
jgi:hypothetical protein